MATGKPISPEVYGDTSFLRNHIAPHALQRQRAWEEMVRSLLIPAHRMGEPEHVTYNQVRAQRIAWGK